MINTVGLLCKGNEEMVPFAFRLYQRYLAGEIDDDLIARPRKAKKGRKKARAGGEEGEPVLGDAERLPDELAPHANGDAEDGEDGEEPVQHGHKYWRARNEIAAFSYTFCRKEQTVHCGEVEENNIKVYFLGIWDCVNSVAVLERKTPVPVPVQGTAEYVRHAVAVDERRVKFKAALLAQDIRESTHSHEDIKEVWFPGCHGDVGGGWPAAVDEPLDTSTKTSVWQRIKNFWTTRKAKEPSRDIRKDPFQMSDIPLAWMIRELELVGEKDPSAAVKWCKSVKGFKKRFQKKKQQALQGVIHDSLSFGSGTSFFKVLLWKFMGKHISTTTTTAPACRGMNTNSNRTIAIHYPLGTHERPVGERPLPAERRRGPRHPTRRGAPRVALLAAAQRPQLSPHEQPRRVAAAVSEARWQGCPC